MDIKRLFVISRMRPDEFAVELKNKIDTMQCELLDVDIKFSEHDGLMSALLIGRERYSIDN